MLLSMLFLSTLAWDYNHFGAYQRGGRLKIFLLAAGLTAAVRISKTWHWSVGLFYAYLVANWLHFGFSPWILPINGKPYIFKNDSIDEMAAITATLFLMPILAEKIRRRNFEVMILSASVIHCVIGILNLWGIYPGPEIKVAYQINLPIGLLGQQTLLGPFLAFAFGIATVRAIESKPPRYWPEMAFSWSRHHKRIAFLGIALLNLAVAILTKSSMTLGSLIAACGVISVFYLGLVPTVIFGALSGLGLFVASGADPNLMWHSGRLEPWKDALSLHQLVPSRSWFGFGIGSWEPVSVIIKEVRNYQYPWTYLHFDPLQALFELGRVGVGILVWSLAVLLGRIHVLYLFRSTENLTWILGLVVFGVNSLANFPLHIVPHGPIFALSVYMLFRSTKEIDQCRPMREFLPFG